MKVLYLSTTAELGGAEWCLLDLLGTLRAARPAWDLEVIAGAEGPLRLEVERLGIAGRVAALPESLARLGDAGLGRRTGRLALAIRAVGASPAVAVYLGRLRRTLAEARPDLIQTNTMKAHVLGALAAPRGVPVLWHLHDYLGPRPAMARVLRLAARRKSLAVVAVSESVAADAAATLGPRVPVATIANAIDLKTFRPPIGDGSDVHDLDALAGWPTASAGTIRVGLVATFARWKGHGVFLEAVARLGPALPRPCRFYVVGGPIYRSLGSQWTLAELRARAEALGIADRVGFVGHQTVPARALRALDIVVHASDRPEPFGRVIVEGMACGRAVIASRLGGAAGLFGDGVEALGVPAGDPAALADALARLLADDDLRRRLGAAGRRAAVARFDRHQRADSWTAVYERLVGLRAEGPGR